MLQEIWKVIKAAQSLLAAVRASGESGARSDPSLDASGGLSQRKRAPASALCTLLVRLVSTGAGVVSLSAFKKVVKDVAAEVSSKFGGMQGKLAS